LIGRFIAIGAPTVNELPRRSHCGGKFQSRPVRLDVPDGRSDHRRHVLPRHRRLPIPGVRVDLDRRRLLRDDGCRNAPDLLCELAPARWWEA
jgi:hypothetical protein